LSLKNSESYLRWYPTIKNFFVASAVFITVSKFYTEVCTNTDLQLTNASQASTSCI
jgi:hypothetical protein